MRCDCCGGGMPDEPIWSYRRDDDPDECTGDVDPETGRCRAWADEALWEPVPEDAVLARQYEDYDD